MKKYILIIIICLFSDIYLYKYYIKIENEKKVYEYKNNDLPLLYQKKDIILNNIEDFVFDDYFKILSFNDESYNYKFEDDVLKINIKNIDDTYEFKYELTKPKIIEKTVYKTVTEYIDGNSNDSSFEYFQNDTKLINDYFSFPLGTDLGTIISTIGSQAIESDESVTCDYSSLNPYEIGLYSVNLYTNSEIYTIICEIK